MKKHKACTCDNLDNPQICPVHSKVPKEEPTKILCRGCAAWGGCKLEKKGNATKCRNHWEHIATSDFFKG